MRIHAKHPQATSWKALLGVVPAAVSAGLLWAFVALFAGAAQAAVLPGAEPRHALVIGNATYPSAPLVNSANDAQVYVDLGRAYEKNDQPDKANENYARAISLNPRQATAYLRAGVIQVRAKHQVHHFEDRRQSTYKFVIVRNSVRNIVGSNFIFGS